MNGKTEGQDSKKIQTKSMKKISFYCLRFPGKYSLLSYYTAIVYTKICSLLEWYFIISIDTCWDWFKHTYVFITAQKNL